MGFKKVLLKLAMKVLQQVLDVIAKQINRMQQEVMEEIMKWISAGFEDMWRGEDAEEFKDEVQRLIVQPLSQAIGNTQTFNQSIQRGCDCIMSADKKVAGLVSDLNNVFAKVF